MSLQEEDSASREEQRLLRSMARDRVSAQPRTRSWNPKPADLGDLHQQIHSAEGKPVKHLTITTNPTPTTPVHPIHPAHHPQPDNAAQSAPSSDKPLSQSHEEVPASEKQEETRQLTPEEEEERRKEQERKVKQEEERFARYLGRNSTPNHSRTGSGTVSPTAGISRSGSGTVSPTFNKPAEPTSPRFNGPSGGAPLGAIKPIAGEKSPRQAVMLEISGHGSTKGEAGKQTTFSIKSKSVNIDTNKSALNVTVKITAKNNEGHVVDIDNTVVANEGDGGYTVTYMPVFLGVHTIDVYVSGHLGHTMAVPVVEGGPIAANSEATWSTLGGASVGNKTQLIVTPMSFIKRAVSLGYSNLEAKVDHVHEETRTPIKNVSVLAAKDGGYVVTFYPNQAGKHIITVTLNGQSISGSPHTFHVAAS